MNGRMVFWTLKKCSITADRKASTPETTGVPRPAPPALQVLPPFAKILEVFSLHAIARSMAW
jgi:hypothetical protein